MVCPRTVSEEVLAAGGQRNGQYFGASHLPRPPVPSHQLRTPLHDPREKRAGTKSRLFQTAATTGPELLSHVCGRPTGQETRSARICQTHARPGLPTTLPSPFFIINFSVFTNHSQQYVNECKFLPPRPKQKQSKKRTWPNFSALLPGKHT